MLHKLIDHSPDLKKLKDEGYELQIKNSHVLINSVPYLNSKKQVSLGSVVVPLTIAGNRLGIPRNHVVYFIGEHPCNKDGSIIAALTHVQRRIQLADGIVVDRSFSNKPQGGFKDYYQMITSYVNIISGPAISLDNSLTPKTFKFLQFSDESEDFHYPDTNTSRSGIGAITAKLRGMKIGIIGMGGTGSYLLDFLAKCPVGEIRIFDNDQFVLHNAFRAPGAPDSKVLMDTPKKVRYFYEMYSKMHKNIVAREKFIIKSNLNELEDLNTVFICVDNGAVKEYIINYLSQVKIDFIDVGMGLQVSDSNSLFGLLRITSSTKGNINHINGKGRISFRDMEEDDEYHQNIQIAELNALNAALAIIKWKKNIGFYYSAEKEQHSIYCIDDNTIINEDFEA